MSEKQFLKPKQPQTKLMDTSKFVFCDVDLNSCKLKSPAWKHFLRDQKNGVAKCKICQAILKSDSSTSGLVRHLDKVHNIQSESESVDTSGEPVAKKSKISSFFQPKAKGPELQELVAKMTAVDGFSFAAISSSESLHFICQKAGYTLPKNHSDIRNLAVNQYESIKNQIKSEIQEAKEAGIRLSITNDESTSARNRRFMNMNAHFETNFKSLGMARVNGSLPGVKCAELVMKRLEEYGIELWMVVCFTTDAAKVMGKFIRSLPINILHQECLTHGIHLAGNLSKWAQECNKI